MVWLLQLDRSLVDGIDQDPGKLALVEMLGFFPDRIGASVLAEGVERVGEATALRKLGVPLAQGYFFARPSAPWCELSEEAERFFTGAPAVDGRASMSRFPATLPLFSATEELPA